MKSEIRTRYIQAIQEIAACQALSIAAIMQSVGDVPQSFSQLNNGRRFPTIDNLALLCQQYGYNAEWLLLGTGRKKGKTDLNAAKMDEIAAALEHITKIISG